MRWVVPFILALTLNACPVAASQNDIDTIEEVVEAAIEARGTVDYDEARDDIHAIYVEAPAGCQPYADAAHVALLLIDLGERYPDSIAIASLFQAVMAAVPTYRNDCLLAI